MPSSRPPEGARWNIPTWNPFDAEDKEKIKPFLDRVGELEAQLREKDALLSALQQEKSALEDEVIQALKARGVNQDRAGAAEAKIVNVRRWIIALAVICAVLLYWASSSGNRQGDLTKIAMLEKSLSTAREENANQAQRLQQAKQQQENQERILNQAKRQLEQTTADRDRQIQTLQEQLRAQQQQQSTRQNQKPDDITSQRLEELRRQALQELMSGQPQEQRVEARRRQMEEQQRQQAREAVSRGNGPSSGYAGRIISRIKSNLVFNRAISGNPEVEITITAASDGVIRSQRITKASGHPEWDEAVMRAIERTEVLPRDVDGSVPSPMVIVYRFAN